MVKQNWFETLNQALESEQLIDLWELGLNINYGETVRMKSDNILISITRSSGGMYERPIHYSL